MHGIINHTFIRAVIEIPNRKRRPLLTMDEVLGILFSSYKQHNYSNKKGRCATGCHQKIQKQ